MAASREAEILAAQEDLAPSQTMAQVEYATLRSSNSHRVWADLEHGHANLVIRTTVEEGDGCAGAGGCADGTAEGGEHTNVALDVDGEEVADEQGSVQGLLIGPQLLGVQAER